MSNAKVKDTLVRIQVVTHLKAFFLINQSISIRIICVLYRIFV